MLKDSAPEKWEYREHTRVKHELLRKYLRPWIIKLGSYYRTIVFFDCFAGRGEYKNEKGEIVALGSPIIALQVANTLLVECKNKERTPYFDELICIGIEKDRENFLNLERIMEEEEEKLEFKNKLKYYLVNNEFSKVVNEVLEKMGGINPPSFFFIDPFGFSGVPFNVVKRIMSLKRTEIFFTLMTRDINRFLGVEAVEAALDELYPVPDWREIYKIPNWQKRDQALKDLYVRCLVEIAGVKYVFPFRVCLDEKYQTLYYLIHATNHFDGLKIMKDIMHKQGASGLFAYLGPIETIYRGQITLFDDNILSLKNYLLDKFGGATKTFKEILEETYMLTQFVESHYRNSLKELEKEGKIRVNMVTSKTIRGLGGNDIIIFPKSNPIQNSLPISLPKATRKIKVYYKEYPSLEEKKEILVHRVNDGSIITRFDKTSLPQKETDIVCPHFLELKWAYGCPYDCAWCYLKGTFRFRPEGTSPVIKDYDKIKLHTKAFLEQVKTPEILNTGEIADSLMNENADLPFSKFIIPMFEAQRVHKVLFLTKSCNVKNLLEMKSHNQVIVSFSLNAVPVAKRWEKAPAVSKRIEAAKRLFDAGYEVRIRIDPVVPIENWQEHYYRLLDIVFDNLTPERVTLGSLRGLQSTINGCTDKSWVKYLKESSNWGKKIDYQTRLSMYSTIIQHLRLKHNFEKVALCKETVHMWHALKMDYKKIRCNCIW